MINIRHFIENDLDAVYEISLATGLAGCDASHLYHDRKMMGHLYAAPYALLNTAFALVLEDEFGVAGFAIGTIDTVSWERKLELEWWPLLRHQYIDPPVEQENLWTPDQRRAFMIHHPANTPIIVSDKYPAHLHMNLLPREQKRGLGSKLFDTWLTIAKAQGAEAIHVAVNKANAGAIHFWNKKAFGELLFPGLTEGRTLWMGR